MSGFTDWWTGETEKRKRQAEREARDNAREAEAEREARNREEREKHQAVKEAKAAQEKAEHLQQVRERERREAEIKQQQMEKEKSEIDEERQKLLAEINKRIEDEKKQMSFNWGNDLDLQWTDDEKIKLQHHVQQPRRDSDGNKIVLRILVFGPTGHGKSSFCNGCRAAIKGSTMLSTYHQVGGVGMSLSQNFHQPRYGDVYLIDMPGIFESKEIRNSSIEDIMSGKIPFCAKILENLEVKDKESLYLPAPGENAVSCVIIVLKYDAELGPEVLRQIQFIVKLGGKGVLSFHLVLTHLDECDPQFNITNNIPNLYRSPAVQEAVKKMSQQTGIPPYAMSFVKNCTTELQTNVNTSLLYLRVLERVIESAVDQVELVLDVKRGEAFYIKSQTSQQTQGTIKFDQRQGRKDLQRKEESSSDIKAERSAADGFTITSTVMVLSILVIAILMYFHF